MRWQAACGAVLGLVLGGVIIGVFGPHRQVLAPTGPMIGEGQGALRTIAMQYAPGGDFLITVYRSFLTQLPGDVEVILVCPERGDLDSLMAGVGAVRQKVTPVFTHHIMTAWSRDRWVTLTAYGPGRPITVLAPRGELMQETWPGRAGDSHLAEDLGRAMAGRIEARRSTLYFDGGDYLADGENVFVGPTVVERNVQHTVGTREELVGVIEGETHRKVILLDEPPLPPAHHLTMFMVPAGRTMVVGDVGLARGLIKGDEGVLAGFGHGADFSREMQASLDGVAERAVAAGYRVVRIPLVPGLNDKAYMTYTNVVLDPRGGRPVVYMPVYEGVERLNAAARGVWEGLGYEVREVDCTATFGKGGTLHCLVNVLERR